MSVIESLFNVTTLPPGSPDSDLYSYLLPKWRDNSTEPQDNEHDAQASVQDFLDMWSICPMPPTPPHLTSAITVIGNWFRILMSVYDADSNTLDDTRITRFETLLNDVIRHGRLSTPAEEALSPSKRTQLRAYLTQYPLYATLLLVDSLGEPELKQWWLWLLARLREASGAVSYEACLQFDRLREKYQNQLLPCSALFLQNCTLSELRLRLADDKDFDVLSPYLKPTIKKKKSPRLPYQSDNEHKCLLLLDDDEEVEVVTPTDIDGNEQSQYVERKGLLRQPELTHQQQKRQFQLKKAGMSRAIHRANMQLPMGKDALTPAQLSAWIQFHCPPLLEGDIASIAPAERSYWCLLFLSLIGLANFELLVVNRNAKEQEKIKTNSLVYELDRDSHCTSMAILPTDIFKGKHPEHAGVQYYSDEDHLAIVLPWPIQSLLDYIFRLLPANKRHKKSLEEVLGVTQREYQTWLKSKIGDSKQRVAFKVTPAKITRTFFPLVASEAFSSAGQSG